MRVTFIALILFCISGQLTAQNFLGAWGGGGQSYFIDVPEIKGFTSNPRYGVMAIGIVQWQNQLGKSDFYFQTGFDWEQKGGRNITERTSDSSFFKYDVKYRSSYVSVPFQVAYHLRISKSFRVILAPGLYGSRLVFSELEWYKNDNGKEDWGKGAQEKAFGDKERETGWEAGFIGNAMVQVKVADYLWLNGGYRYSQAFTRFFDKDANPNDKSKNLSQIFFFGITYNTSALY